MKRILNLIVMAIVAVLIAPAAAFAQTATSPFPVPWYFAANYGNWGLVGQSPNTYTFFGRNTCNQNAVGTTYFPFATTAPVLIVDSISANTEVVTPSSIVQAGASCGIVASPAHQHNSFTLRSGTGGLQEALNSIGAGSASFKALLILDRNWYTYATNVTGTTPGAIIAAATGNANVVLEDITTAPATFYAWNGTAYAVISGVTGGAAVPTAAATAGAGTGPTISDSGNGSYINVKLTAGTSTATGSIFTLTYATTNAFTYAPVCTIVSTGANVPAGALTIASTYSASHAVVTASIGTTALTASTAYVFRVECK